MSGEFENPGKGILARLYPIDRVLLVVGGPLWILLFSLVVQSYLDNTGYPPLGIAVDSPDGVYPTLEVVTPFSDFADSQLQVGDRLIRLGPWDLAGMDSLTFFVRFVEAAGGAGFVDIEYERDGIRANTSSPVVELRRLAPIVLLLAPSFLIVGVLLFLSSPRGVATRALFHASLALGFALVSLFGGPPWKTLLSLGSHAFFYALFPPLLFRFLCVFPHGRPITKRWVHAVVWASSLVGLMSFTMIVGFPVAMRTGVQIFPLVYVGCLLFIVWQFATTYRNAQPLERRQMKWVVYGAYASIIPPVLAFGWVALAGGDMGYAVLSQVSFVLIPIAFYVAIAQANLFDIDRLISATISFNVLAVGVIAGVLVLAPRVASATVNALGLDSTTGQIAVSVLLAVLAVPLQSVLRSPIERIFFHERYEFDVGIGILLSELSKCPNPTELARLSGEGLMKLVNPETCALYSRQGDSFVPLFAGGAAVPPGFDSDTPLVTTLRARSQPLCLDERTDTDSHSQLDPFDRAVLETLGAHVVVPIARETELALILCLGHKRSGDVYTPTDVALLSSLAHAISQTLARFDQATFGKEMRKLNESLRRYVPSAIAEVIDGGDELEATTREVSVLFVDLRGYTSLTESREAEQIFGAVNRYTEAVSVSVQNHGGSVVEFNGDGMMAVFGAPNPLENKESAALAAGREMATTVPLLAGPDGENRNMRVSVGIATGDAFVGNIRAADRLIWSAIGNTTNLAARLEASTRDLDVDIVIDELTWKRVVPRATDFVEHPGMNIRGRTNSLTVYALSID